MLESRCVRRVGGASERSVDVRIIAATNRMEHLGTAASRIRMDLYHRVATVVLDLPPLRERMSDVHELVTTMLEELAPENGVKSVTLDGWRALFAHDWPGNVRELRHAVQRAVTLGEQELGPMDFFPERRLKSGQHLLPSPRRLDLPLPPPPSTDGLPEGLELSIYDTMMRGAMEHALNTHKTIRAAATNLGMAKSTFADKARLWGLLPRKKKR